jgi:hypothetical protein
MIASPPRTATGLRAIAAALIAPLLALGLALAPAVPAAAADIPGAITSVTTDKTSYGYNERIALAFAWSVPDSATAGDIFSLTLPPELQPASRYGFELLAPDGTVVALAVWDGNRVDFTLTDFADTHDSVAGTGYVTAQWETSVVPTTGAPLVLRFDANAVEVVIGPAPTPPVPCTTDCGPAPEFPTTRTLTKQGAWNDGVFEGTRDEIRNLIWSIQLPGRPAGYTGPVTLVDTPAAGSSVDCDTFSIWASGSLVPGSGNWYLPADRYEFDCTPAGFTLTIDGIRASEYISMTYRGTITDQRLGAYGNAAVFTAPGETVEKEVVLKRTAAGGVGDGLQRVSVGDLVWLDADRDGLQDADEAGIPGVTLVLTGPADGPVTTVEGAPVAPVTTDAAGRYSFGSLPVLPAGQRYTVSIDPVASASALQGLQPTTPAVGGDTAVDSSTGSASSGDLTTNGAADPTLDFGFVPLELPTLPLPPVPGTPDVPPVPATPGVPSVPLAYTGAELPAPALIAALALMVLGAAGAVTARRLRRD